MPRQSYRYEASLADIEPRPRPCLKFEHRVVLPAVNEWLSFCVLRIRGGVP